MVAQTLLRIFPRPENIVYTDQRWKEVVDAISVSKKTADCSGKKHASDTPRRNADDTRFRSDTRERHSAVKCVELYQIALASTNNHPNPYLSYTLYLPQATLLGKAEDYGRRPASDSQSRA